MLLVGFSAGTYPSRGRRREKAKRNPRSLGSLRELREEETARIRASRETRRHLILAMGLRPSCLILGKNTYATDLRQIGEYVLCNMHSVQHSPSSMQEGWGFPGGESIFSSARRMQDHLPKGSLDKPGAVASSAVTLQLWLATKAMCWVQYSWACLRRPFPGVVEIHF